MPSVCGRLVLLASLAQLIFIPQPQPLRHTLNLTTARRPSAFSLGRHLGFDPLLQPPHNLLTTPTPTNPTPPRKTLLCQSPPHALLTTHTPNLPFRILGHERANRNQRGPNAPRRLPALLVKATDAEADFAIGLEAARRRQEAEAGRPQRVRGRQDDAAVVDAGCKGRGRRWAAEGEVPFVEVGFERRGCVV